MKSYVTYGAISAIASAVFSLAMFFAGFQTDKIATGQYLNYLGLLIFAVVLFFGMRDVRENKPNKAITYGGALGAAVMVALFAGLFGAVYNYIHLTFVNPNYAQYVQDLTRAKFEAKGLSDAQIDQAISMQQKFMTPLIQSVSIIIMTPILGTVLGLILAIFIKREPPKEEIKAS